MNVKMVSSEKRRKRTSSDAWLERSNPLHGLSIRAAENIYDSARAGNYAHIQWLYDQIETTDPVLMVCVERRSSALSSLGWMTKKNSVGDEVLANEQADAVDEIINGIENFDEAVEHLGLAFFRGFSHLSPVYGNDGLVKSLDCLNSWNFCRDKSGIWYWNPDAKIGDLGGDPTIEPIGDGELVTVTRRRSIDYPALSVYIRHALGEKDWGRFLERYGIPPVIITMPELASKEDEGVFREAAVKIEEALSGVLPYGSQVTFATEARGTNPFLEFLAHQEKLIVLMSTGGTLASLAESGAGTLAGNAQADVWDQIVRRDSAVIGSAINRCLIRPLLQRLFPGQKILASFEIGKEDKMTASELFDVAAKARAAGYLVKREELEEKSGFTLEKEELQQPGGMPMLNHADSAIAKPLQNARKGGAVQIPPTDDETPQNASCSVSNKNLSDILFEEMVRCAAEEILKDGDESVVENTTYNDDNRVRIVKKNADQIKKEARRK